MMVVSKGLMKKVDDEPLSLCLRMPLSPRRKETREGVRDHLLPDSVDV